MKAHYLAESLSRLKGERMESLIASIKTVGQQTRIMRRQGIVLDGINRFNACLALGIEPRYEEYTGTEDSIGDYIWSVNMERRDLTLY